MEEFNDLIRQLEAAGAPQETIRGLNQVLALGGTTDAIKAAQGALQSVGRTNQATNISQLTQERFESLSDPNSIFFQTFQKNLQRQIGSALEASTPTTSSLLALSLSRGLGYKSAANIAQQQREGVEAKNRDVATRAAEQGTGQLFLNLQGQAGQALGSLAQQSQFGQNLAFQQQQLAEQRRQFNESQPDFFDQLLGAGLQVGSFALGNLIGGSGGSSTSSFGGGNRAFGGFAPQSQSPFGNFANSLNPLLQG